MSGQLSIPAPIPTSAYSSISIRSRHSLYGGEDRIVLDLGSRVWKVGFSGESAPRAVFDTGGLWTYDCNEREAASEIARHLKRWLRRVFYDELMIEPKARKVVVLENPMLPTRIKEMIAKTLFDLLSVPSVSLASSPLCALLSIGRITGLVMDVGNLETCLTPIYCSRPLFSHVRTSPIASHYLSSHLHSLLKRYAVFIPHTTTASTRSPTAHPSRITTPLPDTILTPTIIEEIKTRALFIEPEAPDDSLTSYASRKYEINSNAYDTLSQSPKDSDDDDAYEAHVHRNLRARYITLSRNASAKQATDLSLRLSDGTLSLPGWLRHACTDLFFESSGDADASSLPELLLDGLLKLPIDLRAHLVSNILLVGGGSMLPGFPNRLANSIHKLLHREKRYICLRGLSRYINIINGGGVTKPIESSLPLSNQVYAKEQSYNDQESEYGEPAHFCWERSLLSWVGASLMGAMKASGTEEWTKENWDSAKEAGIAMSDWTRRKW